MIMRDREELSMSCSAHHILCQTYSWFAELDIQVIERATYILNKACHSLQLFPASHCHTRFSALKTENLGSYLLALQVRITDGFGAEDIQVVQSYHICRAWVYVVDQIPWPVNNTVPEEMPSVESQGTDTNSLWCVTCLLLETI